MLIPRYIGLRVYLKGPMIASLEACEGFIGLIVVSSCLKTLAAEIKTDKGHDSFLVNETEFLKTLKGFVDSMYTKFKNEKRI